MRYIVGCMSGTSIDGIDAALVAIDGQGLELTAQLVSSASIPFATELAAGLRDLANQKPMRAGEICALNNAFAQAHIAVIREACHEHKPDFICVHGQTVFHQPPLSWQMIQVAPIVQALECTVLADLRAADIALGGQGAPMTPLADYILFQKDGEQRSVCNLGGFCNITHLPSSKNPDDILGFDACACNHILNAIAQNCLDCDYDRDGAHAQRGRKHPVAAQALLELLQAQQGRSAQKKKSLGTGDEMLSWLMLWKDNVNGADLANSACWAIAQCISQHCKGRDVLICAGGGTLNACLMDYLNQCMPSLASDQFNVPLQQREAMAMAILGACCQDRIAITLAHITGVSKAPLAGTWTYFA